MDASSKVYVVAISTIDHMRGFTVSVDAADEVGEEEDDDEEPGVVFVLDEMLRSTAVTAAASTDA